MNDGAHLGQFPKLSTLAMTIVRRNLLASLDTLLQSSHTPMPNMTNMTNLESTLDDALSLGDLAVTPTCAGGDGAGGLMHLEGPMRALELDSLLSRDSSPHAMGDLPGEMGGGSAVGSCIEGVSSQHLVRALPALHPVASVVQIKK